jgi:uncharacterized protein (DUF2384 family)
MNTDRDSIIFALSEVIKPDAIQKWLSTPNNAFGGMTPDQVIADGDGSLIIEMIGQIHAGVAT